MFQCYLNYGLTPEKLSYKTQYMASEIGNVYNTLIFLHASDKQKTSAWIAKTLFNKERNFPSYPFRIEHQHLHFPKLIKQLFLWRKRTWDSATLGNLCINLLRLRGFIGSGSSQQDVAVALIDSLLLVDTHPYDFYSPCKVQGTSGKETGRRNGTMLESCSLRQREAQNKLEQLWVSVIFTAGWTCRVAEN